MRCNVLAYLLDILFRSCGTTRIKNYFWGQDYYIGRIEKSLLSMANWCSAKLSQPKIKRLYDLAMVIHFVQIKFLALIQSKSEAKLSQPKPNQAGLRWYFNLIILSSIHPALEVSYNIRKKFQIFFSSNFQYLLDVAPLKTTCFVENH